MSVATRTRTEDPTRPAPDPVAVARRIVRGVVHAFLEVEAGCRPLTQLAGVLDPRVSEQVSRHLADGQPGSVVDAIVAIRVCRLTDRRVDAAVVVRGVGRMGVVAVALERSNDGWRVTELARPEHRAAGVPSPHESTGELARDGQH